VDRFLDGGGRRESMMLVAPGGQIDTRAPGFGQRAGKREQEAWKVPRSVPNP
jgi:hypothetical protein